MRFAMAGYKPRLLVCGKKRPWRVLSLSNSIMCEFVEESLCLRANPVLQDGMAAYWLKGEIHVLPV